MRRIGAAWVATIFAALIANSGATQTAFPTRTVRFIVKAEAQRWSEVIKKNNIVVD